MFKACKNQKGSAIVEVAVIFPLMLIITLAFIYFIELSRVGVVMEAAATEGARTLAINASAEEAKKKAMEVMQLGYVSYVGGGFYIIEINNNEVVVKRKIATIPFYGDLEMQRAAQHQNRIEHLYYGKGIFSPGYTGNPY